MSFGLPLVNNLLEVRCGECAYLEVPYGGDDSVGERLSVAAQ